MCHAISRCLATANQKIDEKLSPGKQAVIAGVVFAILYLLQLSIKYFGAFDLSPGQAFVINLVSSAIMIPAALIIFFKGREQISEKCFACGSWCISQFTNR